MPLTVEETKAKARQTRRDIAEMIWRAGGGHTGGPLAMVEIAAVLYHHILRVDPGRPHWEDRDGLVLGKGHSAACVYALSADRGFFPSSRLCMDPACSWVESA